MAVRGVVVRVPDSPVWRMPGCRDGTELEKSWVVAKDTMAILFGSFAASRISAYQRDLEIQAVETIQRWWTEKVQPWRKWERMTARRWIIASRMVLRKVYVYIAAVDRSHMYFWSPFDEVQQNSLIRFDTSFCDLITFWRQLLFLHNKRVHWWNTKKATHWWGSNSIWSEVVCEASLGCTRRSDFDFDYTMHRMFLCQYKWYINEYHGAKCGWITGFEFGPFKSVWKLKSEMESGTFD